MKPKTMILMGVAVLCGLVASWWTSQILTAKNKTVKVIVANKKIEAGQFLKEPGEFFEEKELPASEVPPPEMRIGFDELKDRRIKLAMQPGQFAMKDSILDKKFSGIEGVLKKGMKAMSVR